MFGNASRATSDFDGDHFDEAQAQSGSRCKSRYQPRMIETVPIGRGGSGPDALSRLPGDLETRIRFERYSTRADHRGSSIWNRYGDQLKRGEAGTLRWQNEAALFL